jgi:hypothetical protein
MTPHHGHANAGAKVGSPNAYVDSREYRNYFQACGYGQK